MGQISKLLAAFASNEAHSVPIGQGPMAATDSKAFAGYAHHPQKKDEQEFGYIIYFPFSDFSDFPDKVMQGHNGKRNLHMHSSKAGHICLLCINTHCVHLR